MPNKEAILLGDEASPSAAVHAGITVAYAYPGTPSTEIMEFLHPLAKSTGAFKAFWAVNEKTAYEEALGCSLAHGRTIVSMKHVGLNVRRRPLHEQRAHRNPRRVWSWPWRMTPACTPRRTSRTAATSPTSPWSPASNPPISRRPTP